jgi:hypothetical protein
MIFVSIFTIDQIYAQEKESLETEFMENPIEFYNTEGRGMQFLLFIAGVAVYSIFVWGFYRFISRRELIPIRLLQEKDGKSSIKSIIKYAIAYVTLFPLIIFVWFFVLGYFIFIVAQDMPMHLSFFISMAIIGVVRIVAYFREDASKEVAKMIPYAMLSIFLTSAVVYTNPNFIEPVELLEGLTLFTETPEAIIPYVTSVVMFEWAFRVIFIVKRKIFPVSEKKLEEDIEKEINERLNIHYKKMESKEKEMEKKYDEMLKKLKDSKNLP